MSEQTQIDELNTLRQTVAELTQKNSSRKQRITELEQQLAVAQTATATAQANLHEIEVTRPLQTLAKAISPTPELFLLELERTGHKVIKGDDGKLTLTLNNKPVEQAELTVDGLKKLLLTDAPELKNFAHLIATSRASGGGAAGMSHGRNHSTEPTEQSAKPTKLSFGLRGSR